MFKKILYILIFFIFIIFIYMLLQMTLFQSNLIINNNLTEDEKKSAISIVSNNLYVNDQLNKIISQYPGNINKTIKNITILNYSFYNIDKNILIDDRLPAVEILLENENYSGVLLAFVNLRKERVSYISYKTIKPSGYIKPIDDITIIDTGYEINKDLTNDQKFEAIDIALKNKSIKNMVINYTTISVNYLSIESGYPYRYILLYPNVQFIIKNNTNIYRINILIDINNKKIIDINQEAVPSLLNNNYII